jgi:hypothetical protein
MALGRLRARALVVRVVAELLRPDLPIMEWHIPARQGRAPAGESTSCSDGPRHALIVTVSRERLGVAQRLGGWFSVAVSMLTGLTIAYGSISCSPSSSQSSSPAGSSCKAAGGTCVLGDATCAQRAASSAQDCNPPPENPGGAFCCLALQEGGITSANDGGGNDGSSIGASIDGDAGDAGSSAPCNPLFPPSTTLGTILGVGEDTQSTLYVADEMPAVAGQDRVFVSNDTTLDRQHVAGTGQSGSSPNADYTLSFQPPFADAGDLRALLIQVRGGVVTGMALGPGNSRSFLGTADAGQVPLTVLDAGAIVGFKLQNLPNVIEHVADVSNGDAIVVTAPMDAWGTSGFRLFYGKADAMVEYPITSVNADDYGQYIAFQMGGMTYNVFFNDPFGIDGGGGPGPGSLYTDGGGADPALQTIPGALTVTERTPTPTSLAGFSFTCSTAAGG